MMYAEVVSLRFHSLFTLEIFGNCGDEVSDLASPHAHCRVNRLTSPTERTKAGSSRTLGRYTCCLLFIHTVFTLTRVWQGRYTSTHAHAPMKSYFQVIYD